MNTIISASKAQTMSSREIAEVTGKRHDHVMTDIQKMLADLNLHAPDFSGTYQTERLTKELMRPDHSGDKDGFWWFVLHLLALIAVFGLGCVVGGAV